MTCMVSELWLNFLKKVRQSKDSKFKTRKGQQWKAIFFQGQLPVAPASLTKLRESVSYCSKCSSVHIASPFLPCTLLCACSFLGMCPWPESTSPSVNCLPMSPSQCNICLCCITSSSEHPRPAHSRPRNVDGVWDSGVGGLFEQGLWL